MESARPHRSYRAGLNEMYRTIVNCIEARWNTFIVDMGLPLRLGAIAALLLHGGMAAPAHNTRRIKRMLAKHLLSQHPGGTMMPECKFHSWRVSVVTSPAVLEKPGATLQSQKERVPSDTTATTGFHCFLF